MQNILIVEDEINMWEIYKDILGQRTHQYSLVFARTTKEALTNLRNKKFDKVILDIIMEHQSSGESLFNFIRNDKELKKRKIPVVIVSVLPSQQLDHLKKLGNVKLLSKPINEVDFLNALQQRTFS